MMINSVKREVGPVFSTTLLFTPRYYVKQYYVKRYYVSKKLYSLLRFYFLGFECETGVQAVLMKQGVDPAYDTKINETRRRRYWISLRSRTGAAAVRARREISSKLHEKQRREGERDAQQWMRRHPCGEDQRARTEREQLRFRGLLKGKKKPVPYAKPMAFRWSNSAFRKRNYEVQVQNCFLYVQNCTLRVR